MSVPTYDRFVEPILRYLAAHPDGALARDAHDAAADALGVSEADVSVKGVSVEGEVSSPDDRLEQALVELNGTVLQQGGTPA